MLARSVLIWFMLRAISASAGGAADGVGALEAALSMTLWGRVVVLGIVVYLCELSARRRRELVFLGNLGVSRRAWLAWALLLPLLMEAGLAVLWAVR